MRPSILVDGKRFYILDEIHAFTPGIGRRYQIGQEELAVFKIGEKFFAVQNACPHEGTSLCHGAVRNNCEIECPAHGWTFDMSTGRRNVDHNTVLQTFETHIQDETVWVCIDR